MQDFRRFHSKLCLGGIPLFVIVDRTLILNGLSEIFYTHGDKIDILDTTDCRVETYTYEQMIEMQSNGIRIDGLIWDDNTRNRVRWSAPLLQSLGVRDSLRVFENRITLNDKLLLSFTIKGTSLLINGGDYDLIAVFDMHGLHKTAKFGSISFVLAEKFKTYIRTALVCMLTLDESCVRSFAVILIFNKDFGFVGIEAVYIGAGIVGSCSPNGYDIRVKSSYMIDKTERSKIAVAYPLKIKDVEFKRCV